MIRDLNPSIPVHKYVDDSTALEIINSTNLFQSNIMRAAKSNRQVDRGQ